VTDLVVPQPGKQTRTEVRTIALSNGTTRIVRIRTRVFFLVETSEITGIIERKGRVRGGDCAVGLGTGLQYK
ncbi:MAG: hypothetical protein ACK5PZ_20510, partial [Pirellula sp.]